MDFYWRTSGRVHPSRRTGRTRGRSDLAVWVESLENRTLLTVQVGPITAVAGQAFNGQVATFGPNDLQGTIADFQATINWGGGLNFVTPGIITPGSNGSYVVTGSNTYPQVGTYTVTVSLTGLNGSTASGSGTANILDAPLSSVGQIISPTKGSPFVGVVATFQSQNPYAVSSNFSANISWGDGFATAGVIAPNGLGGFNVVGNHTYTSYGTFPTTVTIQSLAGPQSTIAIGQAVLNAQPISLVATNIFPIENTPISPPVQVASFFDPDSTDNASDFTAAINWGDGTLGPATVQAGTGGVYNVLAGRDPGYAALGNYTFVVTVTRTATNQQATTDGQADVSAALPVLTPLSGLIVPTVGASFAGTVGAFQDSNAGAVASDFTAAINWGDGKSSQGNVFASAIPGQFEVTGTHTYTTTGQFPFTILVQDNQGNGTTIQSTAVVIGTSEALTAVPTLIVASPGIGFSGTVGAFIDTFPNAQAGIFTGVITWGDGHTSPASFADDPALPNGFLISGTNIYASAGTFPVSIQLYDNSGHSLTVTSIAAVTGPTIIATGTTFTVTPGQPVPNSTIVANFTDSDPNATASNLVATINWGDGYTSLGAVSLNPTTNIFTVTAGLPSHTYIDSPTTGFYHVTVTIADPTGQTATASSDAVVAGPVFQPISSLLSFTTGVQGPLPTPPNTTTPPVGSFLYTGPATLPSQFTATVTWGDGSTSIGTVTESTVTSGLYYVTATHIYTTASNYAASILVQDDAGNSATITSTASVVGPVISATGTTFTVTAGQPVPNDTIVANFSDSNPNASASNLVATINWGDGYNSTGVISQNPTTKIYTVTAGPPSHTYIDSPTTGVYHVTVTIADPSGQAAVANSDAVVAGPVFQPISSLLNFTAGVQGPLPTLPNTAAPPIGSFLYTGPATLPSQFTATINWGDKSTSVGTVTESTVTSGLYYITATHLYTTAGSYLATILVQDDTGNSATITSLASVVGPAIIATGTTFPETPGQPLPATTIVANFTDSNLAANINNIVATIAWGDGSTSIGTLTQDPTSLVYTVTAGPPGHTYIGSPTNGVYHVTVTIADPSGQTATASSNAVTAGLTFQPIGSLLTFTTGVAGPMPTSPNAPTPPIGSFLYTGPATAPSQFTATITWGDGSTSFGTVTESQATPGLYDVTATHLYVTAGNYSPTILVQDNAGNSVKITSSASVVGPVIIATGTTFPETPGQPLPATTVVANFTDTSGAAPHTISATINWGDGYTTTGVVNPPTGGTYSVTGSHTYFSSNSSSFAVTVTIVDPSGQKATASSTALVAGPVFQPIATQVLFTADEAGPDAIGGTMPPIGSFDYNGTTSAFVASINWGNGNTSAGTVQVSTSNPSIYNVYGTNLYVSPGTYSPTIKVSDQNGQTITITSTAVVNSNAALVFSGGLESIPGNGPGAAAGYTDTNRPTFSGTASPFSTVQLFAGSAAYDTNESLGIAVASGSGQWTLATGPLADGIYTMTAVVTPPAGYPGPLQPLTNNGRLVIDTVAPMVVGISDSGAGKVTVYFRDDLSGMNFTSLSNTSNYSFAGRRRLGFSPTSATVVPAGNLPTDVVGVVLTIPGNRHTWAMVQGLRLAGTNPVGGAGGTNTGITDNAGNPLQGYYGKLVSSASGRAGGNYHVKIRPAVFPGKRH